MSDHEQVRQLLALSAAGLLDAGEERLVRDHIRQCTACSAELEEFAALSAGLSALPVPQPSADLVRRTAALTGRRGGPARRLHFRRRRSYLCLRLRTADCPDPAHAGGRFRRPAVAGLGGDFFRIGHGIRHVAGLAPPS